MLFSKIIEKKFSEVLGRYDGDPSIKYNVLSDFPLLKADNFDIKADNNIMLKGYFYYYDEFKAENLIVFDHGIGAGHEAYLNEINYLAKNGFTVYAYDHTGCAKTKGQGILGFAQGINDLDHVLTALNNDERFKAVPRKIIGHSWGAYSCMNVCALHAEVSHVVSLAGFLSAKSLSEQYIPKPFLKYSVEVMDRERQHNPKYADMNAIDSLLKSKAKLLHLQSKDDIKVKFDLASEIMMDKLKDRPNTEFIILDGHNHDPQRTKAAKVANEEMLIELNKLNKKHKLDNKAAQDSFKAKYNWEQIYEQDPEIWSKIIAFLNN